MWVKLHVKVVNWAAEADSNVWGIFHSAWRDAQQRCRGIFLSDMVNAFFITGHTWCLKSYDRNHKGNAERPSNIWYIFLWGKLIVETSKNFQLSTPLPHTKSTFGGSLDELRPHELECGLQEANHIQFQRHVCAQAKCVLLSIICNEKYILWYPICRSEIITSKNGICVFQRKMLLFTMRAYRLYMIDYLYFVIFLQSTKYVKQNTINKYIVKYTHKTYIYICYIYWDKGVIKGIYRRILSIRNTVSNSNTKNFINSHI